MDVVGSGERRGLLDPLAHGTFAAHHAEHVPVGKPVLERNFAEHLDSEFQSGVALDFAVHLLGHVGGPDEQNVCIGVGVLDRLDLLRDELARVFEVALVEARDEVSAVFHDDEAGVHYLEGFRQEFLVHAGEHRTRAAAHGDVVDCDTVGPVDRDGVDFGIAGEVYFCVRRGVGELPREHAELVELFIGGGCRVHELLFALFLFRTFVFNDGLFVGEAHLEAAALAGKHLDDAVSAYMGKLAVLVFALLDSDDRAAFELAHLRERPVAVVVGAVFFGAEHDEAGEVTVVPHAGRL